MKKYACKLHCIFIVTAEDEFHAEIAAEEAFTDNPILEWEIKEVK